MHAGPGVGSHGFWEGRRGRGGLERRGDRVGGSCGMCGFEWERRGMWAVVVKVVAEPI